MPNMVLTTVSLFFNKPSVNMLYVSKTKLVTCHKLE